MRVEIADGLPVPLGERVLLTNPPWYDREGDRELAKYKRRCLEDPERRLLSRLLNEAKLRAVAVAYVFFGTDDPFEQTRLGESARFLDWRSERSWVGIRGLRLHRLVRC